MRRVVVCGAGGFIGGWLVRRLLDEGCYVRAVDIKPLHSNGDAEEGWWQIHPEAENIDGRVFGDLKWESNCHHAVDGMDDVYNLACDMGGIGFIEQYKARCMLSVLINTQLLEAGRQRGIQRHFYSSSACVYAQCVQNNPAVVGLKEGDAYPDGRADPEDGYGWEKLFSERMCRHYMEDYGLETRVARFHNIMGPHGTWHGRWVQKEDGTREYQDRSKAPAAVCRKVAEAVLTDVHEIDIWGDGTFTRSFCWIEDCVEGICRIMDSDIREPMNLGSSEQVSVNQLVDIVEDIAGIKCKRTYDMTKAQGVPGRNSDNTMILERLGWEPSTSLRYGLEQTYAWVFDQVKAKLQK